MKSMLHSIDPPGCSAFPVLGIQSRGETDITQFEGHFPQKCRARVTYSEAATLSKKYEALLVNWDPSIALSEFMIRGHSVQTLTGCSNLQPILDQPFVRRYFSKTQKGSLDVELFSVQSSSTSDFVRVDKSLFSLGVVLMELWFETPIEKLGIGNRNENSMKSGTNNASKAHYFRTAKQRFGELLNQARQEYAMAVWSCF
ncbi:hypothetical protein K440DRAFT_671520 [Wilcoxina mikolae CBS 423.85]|nr:hypothetical protein K440DRAFT_671520 [Wilcoxina mikolae CBS 423.85]